MILKKIKKVMLLMIFSVIFSAIALSQTGLALTLTPSNDFDATFYSNHYYTNDLQISQYGNEEVSFLQFDISSLKGEAINATTLNLFSQGGSGTASLYYVLNTQNSWVSSPSGYFNQSELNTLIGSSPIALVSGASVGSGLSSFSSVALKNALQNSINSSGNNYFSLALVETKGGPTCFVPNGTNGPNLNVVPAPEPSSILLGLIGLSGILGFRKNPA